MVDIALIILIYMYQIYGYKYRPLSQNGCYTILRKFYNIILPACGQRKLNLVERTPPHASRAFEFAGRHSGYLLEL